MAKVVHAPLTRGVKLNVEHLTQNLNRVTAALNGNIDRDNIPNNYSVLRLNFNIPELDHLHFRDDAMVSKYRTPYCIPFVIPPPQEMFDDTVLKPTSRSPQYILDSLSLSFDTRREAAATVDKWWDYGAAAESATSQLVVATDRLTLRVKIGEKTPYIWKASNEYSCDRTILDQEFNAALYEPRTFRFNPGEIQDLGLTLSPEKSYLLSIDFPGAWNDDDEFYLALESLQISLRILVPILVQDTIELDEVQNAPTSEYDPVDAAHTITPPVSNALIKGDSAADGIHTNIKVIDNVLKNTLQGGLDKNGVAPPYQHIQNDTGWDCIAIPIWNNLYWFKGIQCYNPHDTAAGCQDSFAMVPYLNVATTNLITDRKIIPIEYPMTIHHVIVSRSFTAIPVLDFPNYSFLPGTQLHEQGQIPTSPTFTNYVGVAIGAGIRSNWVGYQQVAYASWTENTKTAYLIDKLRYYPAELGIASSFCKSEYEYELLQIPIVGGMAKPHKGYILQGPPFYIGRGNTISDDRSNAWRQDTGIYDTPVTDGSESFIEVRWGLQDAMGLKKGAHNDHEDTYVGYNGMWVYIFGKKFIA